MTRKYKVNSKAFTLIELLAVIVVLAIIAMIAIPVILGVIDKAKLGALKDSAYGLVEASELYLAKNMGKEIETKEFTCSDGTCLSGTEKISYKGNIDSGRIRVYSDSKIELCITNNKNAALKTVASKEVTVSAGTCNYDELSYGVSALVSKDDYDVLRKQYDELLTEYNNGKSVISQALTNKGIDISASSSFEQMGDAINSLSTELVSIAQNVMFFRSQVKSNSLQKYTATYDIKTFTDKYSELTTNNFIVEIVSDYYCNWGSTVPYGAINKPKEISYSSTTGILTVSLYYIAADNIVMGDYVNIWMY